MKPVLLETKIQNGHTTKVYQYGTWRVEVLADSPEEEELALQLFLQERELERQRVAQGATQVDTSDKFNSPIFVDDKGKPTRPGHWDLTKTPMEWVEDDPE